MLAGLPLPSCRWDQVAQGGDGGSFRDEATVQMIRHHNELARQLNAKGQVLAAAQAAPAAEVVVASDGQPQGR